MRHVSCIFSLLRVSLIWHKVKVHPIEFHRPTAISSDEKKIICFLRRAIYRRFASRECSKLVKKFVVFYRRCWWRFSDEIGRCWVLHARPTYCARAHAQSEWMKQSCATSLRNQHCMFIFTEKKIYFHRKKIAAHFFLVKRAWSLILCSVRASKQNSTASTIRIFPPWDTRYCRLLKTWYKRLVHFACIPLKDWSSRLLTLFGW